MKKILLVLVSILLLSACSFNQTVEPETNTETSTKKPQSYQFVQGDQVYNLLLPFSESNRRLIHSSFTGNLNDTKEISRRLQQFALEHWKSEEHLIAEDKAVPYELYSSLLKYSSRDELGLNPAHDQQFETNRANLKAKGPVIIGDIFEIDFYKDQQEQTPLVGVAFAITLNRNARVNDVAVTLPMDQVVQYGQSAARKLVSVLRTRPQFSQIPILIGLYSLAKDDQNLPGNFVSLAYFEGYSGQFEAVNDRWVILPSTQAQNINPQMSVEFNLFRTEISNFLQSEVIGVVGKARVIDEVVDQVSIEVITSAKTYLEIQGLAQLVASQLSQFEQLDVNVVVEIKDYTTTFAVIEKQRQQSNPTIILLV